jgi:hypothetical protein
LAFIPRRQCNIVKYTTNSTKQRSIKKKHCVGALAFAISIFVKCLHPPRCQSKIMMHSRLRKSLGMKEGIG